MYATLLMDEGDPRDVLAVPVTAVQDIDGTPVVFVAGDGGACTRRDVALGQEVDAWWKSRQACRRRAHRFHRQLPAEVRAAQGNRRRRGLRAWRG